MFIPKISFIQVINKNVKEVKTKNSGIGTTPHYSSLISQGPPIFSRAFHPRKSRKSRHIISVQPTTISSILNQGKITPLGIHQKIDTWGFVSYIKEFGFYYKKMGNIKSSGTGQWHKQTLPPLPGNGQIITEH